MSVLLTKWELTVEGFLAVVVWAQVESQFALGGSYVSQDVIVGFPLQQLVADPRVSVVGRVVKR